MALDSDSVVHILLVGPPASAKTMFFDIINETKKLLLCRWGQFDKSWND